MTKTATATAAETKTQQRAVCPACFAQQAIRKSGRLVPHGYTRPQHWHSNVGTCTGAGEPHFGTEAGREYTRSLATRLRNIATATEANAANVLAGTDPVMTRKRIERSRVYTMVAVENATESQRRQYAASLTQTAQHMRTQAAELDAHVNAWKPAEPITVGVETKQTLLHWRGGYYRGKACASSAMGAQKGYTTSEITSVTCEKCKAVYARFEEKKKTAAAAQ